MKGRASRLLQLTALGALLAAPAGAEIYRWRDAQGREHFTTDLQKVPPGQRDEAVRGSGARGGPVNFNTIDF